MNRQETAMKIVKLKGHINYDRKLEIKDKVIDLPEGDVDITLVYLNQQPTNVLKPLSPLDWPSLDGGIYLGSSMRREEIYDDDGR
jgi:hypothetical protein